MYMNKQCDNANSYKKTNQLSMFSSTFPLFFLLMLYLVGIPLWIIILIGIWYFSIISLESTGYLDKIDATRVLGFILMIRTKKGKSILDRISSFKRFWKFFGEISIWICLSVMALVVFVLLISAFSTILNPREEYIPASDVLFIPGVTSFVPFWWPVIALIVTLVIHEYSHGIQARVHGMRLKSFGLLLMGPLPLGAFAEPEQDEMIRAPRRERMRLFAAGPSINIFATYIAVILLAFVSTGLVANQEGLHIREIIEGEPAQEAGLAPYDAIIEINGTEITDYDSFSSTLNDTSPGDEIVFKVLTFPSEDGFRDEKEVSVVMGDRFEHFNSICEQNNDYERCMSFYGNPEPGKSFLGVDIAEDIVAAKRYSIILQGNFGIVDRLVYTLVTPVIMLFEPMSLDGQTMIIEERQLLEVEGFIPESIGKENVLRIFDFLFWLVWVNFLLGFANLVPMVPFDGGHIVKDAIHSILRRISSRHPIKIENFANKISNYSSFFFLIIILLPLISPIFPW